MKEFDCRVKFETHNEVEGKDEPVGIVNYLCETGKAGRFVHNVENKGSQWDTLCALEDALVDARQNDGFTFVVGKMKDREEVRGWMEYKDVILVPYGPKDQNLHNSDVGVYSREEFDAMEYTIHAMAEAADDSGIVLNFQLRETTGHPMDYNGDVHELLDM